MLVQVFGSDVQAAHYMEHISVQSLGFTFVLSLRNVTSFFRPCTITLISAIDCRERLVSEMNGLYVSSRTFSQSFTRKFHYEKLNYLGDSARYRSVRILYDYLNILCAKLIAVALRKLFAIFPLCEIFDYTANRLTALMH